jgi:hypothetical protein
MTVRRLMAFIAAVGMATVLAVPGDARPAKKQKRPAAVQTQQPSLDGRITGRTRTCGFDTLQYDGMSGVPSGPYCH